MDFPVPSQELPPRSESAGERRLRFAIGHAIIIVAHQLIDEPCLYYDDLLARLVGLSPGVVHSLLDEDFGFRMARFYAAARSRFVDESATEAVDDGIRQIVLLDAGLTTVAHRKYPPDMRVFEVDQAAGLRWKRRRLTDIGTAVPETLRYVEARDGPLPLPLDNAGFDRQKPALFVWTDLLLAMSSRDIGATLSYIGECAGARLVFDYMQPAESQPEFATLTGLGLEHATAFTPGELTELLNSVRLGDFQDCGGLDLISRYMPSPVTGPTPININMHVVRATARR